MPVQKRTAPPPRLFELVGAIPYPAWIKDGSGRILARNGYPKPPSGRRSPKTTTAVYYLPFPPPLVEGGRRSRLVITFPSAQGSSCLSRIIFALLTKTLLDWQSATATDKTHHLTPREREVYCELASGCCYKEAATRIGISHEVVRQLVLRIRRKLGEACLPPLRRRL